MSSPPAGAPSWAASCAPTGSGPPRPRPASRSARDCAARPVCAVRNWPPSPASASTTTPAWNAARNPARPGRRRRQGRHRPHPRRRRPGRHLLRHRPGLRPVHQRGTGRAGPGTRTRRRRHRHQVRLLLRRLPVHRPGQPPRAHPGHGGGLPAPAGRGQHRPALPAPCRPRRADRGGRRCGEGTHRGGQGQALRPVRGRGGRHPPRPRRTAGHGPAERVLPVVARARGADPAHAARTRHRLRPLQPAGQGFPDRRDLQHHVLRRLRPARQPAAVHRGGPRGQPGPRRPVVGRRRPQRHHQRPDRAGLAARPAPLDRADPRHHEDPPSAGEHGRGGHRARPRGPGGDHRGGRRIDVSGDRYPEHMQRWINR